VHRTDTDNVTKIVNAHLTAGNFDGDILDGDAGNGTVTGGDGNDTPATAATI
jgi:hypothetical protein